AEAVNDSVYDAPACSGASFCPTMTSNGWCVPPGTSARSFPATAETRALAENQPSVPSLKHPLKTFSRGPWPPPHACPAPNADATPNSDTPTTNTAARPPNPPSLIPREPPTADDHPTDPTDSPTARPRPTSLRWAGCARVLRRNADCLNGGSKH